MMIDLRLGDCIEVMKTLPDNSVDSIITDPPYHLTSTKGGKKGFMGKEWDGGDIAFRTEVWEQALRVLKPGGHLLAFGGSRTYHRLAVAIEDAGFEIRDQILWIYGSGFPKSLNIGKAIDKIQGNEREVIGTLADIHPRYNTARKGGAIYGDGFGESNTAPPLTKGNSDWEGWGTALKPAHEPIVMARKPLSEKSVALNVLEWGTGGINIDESRIQYSTEDKEKINFDRARVRPNQQEYFGNELGYKYFTDENNKEYNTQGRFPANVMFDEEAGKLLDEQSGIKKSQKRSPKYNKDTEHTNTYTPPKSDYRDDNTYDDMGGASRFFYSPKSSKKDKGEFNTHPTTKPTLLMEYLIKLITPKGGVVLDCFMGSGSTGVAAIRNEYSFLGIEKEQEYLDIAQQRIDYENRIKRD